MPPEIFASYSREDQAQVFPIVDKLRERGINIWIDQEGIHGAKLWSQEIVNAIESSKVFILFASAKAFHSKNVTKELALASESDKHILPIFIEDAEIPAAMKYQLAGIQHLVHEEGQTEQTADNILRTLGNLDIQSTEPQPTATTTPPTTKPASKTPLVAVTLVIALAVIAFLLFKGGRAKEIPTKPSAIKTYKSTTDLCIVTVYDTVKELEVSVENRELREELDAKLSRFKDYKVDKGKAVSPDATTQELLDIAKTLDAEFILIATIESDKKRINVKLHNVEDGRNFWSKTLRESDVKSSEDFIDEATGLIAARIAGHDGAIHRDILKKALVKKEEDMTPMELLQMGKALWEESTSENMVKAIDYLNKCVQLNPDISTAYAILSEVYLEDIRGDFNKIPDAMKKAKDSINRAMDLNPSNAIAIIEQIWISWYEKDVVSVKLQVESALKANPYEPLVLASAGAFNAMTGADYQSGIKQLDQALKYNDTPQGWYYLGYVTYYISINNLESALEFSLKMSANTHFDLPIVSALFWLNGDKVSALKYYQELADKYPNFDVKDFEYSMDAFTFEDRVRNTLSEAYSEVESAAKPSE
jgi:tetratricopeptide (TPR) repeat protein